MPSRQPRRREIEQTGIVLIDQPAALLGRAPVLSGNDDRRAGARGRAFDDRERFARLRGNDSRHVALEDPGLLIRDLCDAVAEIIGVIERDRRHDRGKRCIDHVGRVEPPAEPDFEQHHVGGVACEQQEPGGGRDLEHRDRLPRIGPLAFLEHGGELVIRYQCALAGLAETEALVEPDEMRRGIDMHAQARRLKDRAHEGDGRTLAVGAGDMDDRRQLAFRMTDRGQEPPHAIEREVDQLGMQREEPRDDGIDGRHARGVYRNHPNTRMTLTRWSARSGRRFAAVWRRPAAVPARRQAPW